MTADCQWHDLYKAAMLELNPTKLRKQIQHARDAIHKRSEDLIPVCDADSLAEQRAMADALYSLGAIERSELRSDIEASNQNSENAVRQCGIL
jgi:hypothetical protein